MPKLIQPNITGARKDISDALFFVDAEETPYLSLVPKGDQITNGDDVSWPADLPGHVSGRGKKDGSPAKPITGQSDDYNLVKTRPHWFQETVGVGKKAENLTDRAGVGHKKLMAREVMKALKALKTTADRVCCDDTDSRAEGADGSETRGLGSWFSTAAQADLPVPEKYRPESDAVKTTAWGDIVEETIQDLVDAIYLSTGTSGKFLGLAGIKMKRKISSWSVYSPDKASTTQLRQVNQGVKDRILTSVVDLLECDSGTVELRKSRNLGWDRDFDKDTKPSVASTRRLYILDTKACKLRQGWGPVHEPLPNDGGGKAGIVEWCVAHCVTPKTGGVIKPS
ncbi:DUF5309 family protein [Ruficoccus sp. ZRK36]|uniref:SU10 major capsid protein n=1 Tax=Ruficoccus sp. ZRK36 TaxID=2866311 RepID=UPI001C735C47|nr:DUF5309 family protein [Ruficoccus sp. ZRK36]QYY35309.1 DUF5309 family protein [Ruficoccus sp. ZRK36]